MGLCSDSEHPSNLSGFRYNAATTETHKLTPYFRKAILAMLKFSPDTLPLVAYWTQNFT